MRSFAAELQTFDDIRTRGLREFDKFVDSLRAFPIKGDMNEDSALAGLGAIKQNRPLQDSGFGLVVSAFFAFFTIGAGQLYIA